MLPPRITRLSAVLALACAFAACAVDDGVTDCGSDDDCRSAFGVGFTCRSDGLCDRVAIHPRCTRTYPRDLFDDPGRYRDRIVVGALYSPVGESILATELGFIHANRAGGIDGQQFAVVACDYVANDEFDDLGGVDAAVDVTGFLIDTLGVTAIHGPGTSDRAVAVYEAYGDRDVLFISGSATSPVLSTIDGDAKSDEDPGNFWRTVPSDDVQGVVIARDLLVRRHARDVVVLFETGAYGEGLVAPFEQTFLAEGGQRVIRVPFDDDLGVALVAALEEPSDYILFVAAQVRSGVTFLGSIGVDPDLRELLGTRGIFLTDGVREPALITDTLDTAADLYPRIHGSRPAPSASTLDDAFEVDFRDEFDIEPSGAFEVHNYDAAWLLVYATAWSILQEGGVSSLGLGRGLRQLSAADDPIPVLPGSNLGTVLDHFRAGEPVNIEGTSGELSFDPETEEILAPIEIWGISGTPEAGYGFTAEYTTSAE